MMDAQQIADLSAEAASRAARENREPAVFFNADTAESDVRSAPFLGNYTPPSWTPAQWSDFSDALPERADCQSACASQYVDEFILWVDKLGIGSAEEPAIGLPELISYSRTALALATSREQTLAVGICEEGQFQIYLRFFVRPWEVA